MAIVRHDDVPKVVVELVEAGRWDYGPHVIVSLSECLFTEEDIQECVCCGRLAKRESDERGEAVDGWKYTVYGRCRSGHPLMVVGKIVCDADGALFFVITAHGRNT